MGKLNKRASSFLPVLPVQDALGPAGGLIQAGSTW